MIQRHAQQKKARNKTFDNLYTLHLIQSLPLLVVATQPPMFHSLVNSVQLSNAPLSISVTDDEIKMACRSVKCTRPNRLKTLTKVHSCQLRAILECPRIDCLDGGGCRNMFEQCAVQKCIPPNYPQPRAKVHNRQMLATFECILLNHLNRMMDSESTMDRESIWHSIFLLGVRRQMLS